MIERLLPSSLNTLPMALLSTLFSLSLWSPNPVFAAERSPATCPEFETRFMKPVKPKNSGPTELKLRRLIEGSWDYWMREYPEWATYVGYPDQNDRWSEYTLEARTRRNKILDCQIHFTKQIAAAQLSPKDKLNLELFRQKLDFQKQFSQFDHDLILVTQLDGIHLNLPDLVAASPRQKYKDFEDTLTRLNQIPVVLDQIQSLMKTGVEKKYTHVKFLMEKVPAQIEVLLNSDYAKNPIYRDFQELPSFLTETQKLSIQAKAKEIIGTKVIPAFKKFKKFIETEYIPKCRTDIAALSLPKGASLYALSARVQTTTDWDSKRIHELGISEVARIQKEMEALKDSVKFNGDLKTFNKHINSSSQFFYKDPKDLIAGYREISKRIDPELPGLFKTLPRLPYGVKAMPEYKGSSAPTAYYQPGSPATGRAGYFEANTVDLKSRPIWEMEALTAHEAVPGHHLQIALAQEMSELPEFRKNDGYTAFVEGWALYAESLGYDLGLYRDPYSRYGQLVYDMWRAARLVVDTGMHSMGWSKTKALDYMMEKVGKPRFDIENEIDRYITWPGQALAYKVGQLKFLELKEKSKKQLGEKFDVREFHDEVLRHGAVPMSVLEKLHADWLKKTASSGPKTAPKNPSN